MHPRRCQSAASPPALASPCIHGGSSICKPCPYYTARTNQSIKNGGIHKRNELPEHTPRKQSKTLEYRLANEQAPFVCEVTMESLPTLECVRSSPHAAVQGNVRGCRGRYAPLEVTLPPQGHQEYTPWPLISERDRILHACQDHVSIHWGFLKSPPLPHSPSLLKADGLTDGGSTWHRPLDIQ